MSLACQNTGYKSLCGAPESSANVSIGNSLNSRIDRLRGLFALFVVLGHAFDVSEQYVNTNSHLGSTLFAAMARVRPLLGFVWVVGFIVLSGFCIEQSCKTADTRGFQLKKFWIARVSRLLPVLLIAGLVAGGCEWIMRRSVYRPDIWTPNLDWQHLLITVLAAGGFYGTFACLAPAYTLSYEILYYLFWSISRKTLGSPRNTFFINLVMVSLFIWLHTSLEKQLPGWLAAIFSPTIIILYIAWLVGAAVSNHIAYLLRNRVTVFVAKFSWLILISFLLYAQDNYQCPSFVQSIERSVVYYGILGLCFALVIVGCYTNEGDVMSKQACQTNIRLGLLSYPLYLIHGPIIIFMGFIINRSGIKIRFDLHFLILTTSAIIASWAVVVFVERPVLEFRKKYLARR